MQYRYYRKVIKIRGQDSPNVRYALAEIAAGRQPSGKMIVDGVLGWWDYQKRRELWDKIRQTVGLDAEFWEGSELLLFPPQWLDRAEDLARRMGRQARVAKALGVDPAEGGDKTSMAVVDELGLIEMRSAKTPDTTDVTKFAFELMRKYNLRGDQVMFDRGGGGKQHADRMRLLEEGHGVSTVAFGAVPSKDPKRGMVMFEDKLDTLEDRGAYVNRRAELYYELSAALDPSVNPQGFAIPGEYANLRDELAPIPKMQDREGKWRLLPKHKQDPASKEKTLVELIGHSPDEADALAIAYHRMTTMTREVVASAF